MEGAGNVYAVWWMGNTVCVWNTSDVQDERLWLLSALRLCTIAWWIPCEDVEVGQRLGLHGMLERL